MKILKVLSAAIQLVVATNLFSQTLPPVVSGKYLRTLTTVPSQFTVTENDMFTEVTAGPPIPFKDKSVTNYVKLAIDPGKDDFISGSKTYAVDVEIKVWNVNGTFTGFTTSTVNKTLTINYVADNSATYNDINLYAFEDAYKIQVKVQHVYLNGSITTAYSSLPNSIYIEAGIEVERYYDFDPTDNPEDLVVEYDEDNQYINIKDFNVDGAVAYDIEWTYVNNYDDGDDVSGELSTSELSFRFHNNSSRIRVYSDETISIPAVFDRGYVIVRARGIGRTGTDLDKDWYGDWSIHDDYDDGAADPYLVNSLAGSTFYTEIGSDVDEPVFESNKNWMYQLTFAEEGKMKHVISYFDGTSRNRQAVTLINSTNEAIVAETYYDFQGRAAVQSMPVPVNMDLVGSTYVPNKQLNYREKFNRSGDDDDDEFSRLDFDLDADEFCTPTQNPFDDSYGAGLYYSPNNPILTKHNAFIPDAEGYAYTLTEFMPDNTGRVRRQTGVGPDHNFASEHYTSYFYGKPFQEELDRLFGTNVGDAAHYQKNMVVDPNGQVSVSYLDMRGNVIATALAGPPPPNMTELKVEGTDDSQYEASIETNTIDLLDISPDDLHGSSNELSADGMSYIMYTPVMVTSESDYDFTYTLEEKDYLEECLSEICFDCVYDINITLLDLCGNPAGEDGIDVHKTIGDAPLADGSEGSLECSTIGTDVLYGEDMTATEVPVGIYYLDKELSINTDALETYANLYIEQLLALPDPEVDVNEDGIEDALQDLDDDDIYGEEQNCFRSFNEFYDAAVAAVDVSDCELSCEDCALLEDNVGDFITAHALTDPVTDEETAALTAAYNEAKAFCDAMCSSPGNDFCLVAKNMMLADVSPGGQYAQYYDEATNTVDPSIFHVSIMNTENDLQKRDFVAGPESDWRHPVRYIDGDWVPGYFNEDGSERAKILMHKEGDIWYPACATPFSLDGLTYCYPENLDDPKEFVDRFESSWAYSLLAYHPEYYYYEDCLELYTPADDVIIEDVGTCNDCNSFQFDEYLLGLDYATVEGTAIINPQDFDPFFDSDNYLSVKDDFVDKFIDGTGETYGDCDLDIYEFSWLQVNITPEFYSITDCPGLIAELPVGDSWDHITNDEEWHSFVLSYLAAKYQFWLSQADLYANDEKAYHGCIGQDYYFQYDLTAATPFDDLDELWEGNYVCGLPQGVYMTDDVSRFPDMNSEFGIGEGDDLTAELDELLGDADVAYFEATGNQPLAYDLEQFLNGLISVGGGWLPTASFPITDDLALTPRLYEEFTGLGLSDWDPVYNVDPLEMDWGTGDCLTLTLPSGSFSGILSFHDIHTINPATGEFSIIANYPPLTLDGPEEEVEIQGTYCGTLDDMTFYTTDCELSPEANAVWGIMNALISSDFDDNFNAASPISIDDAGYAISAEFEPVLAPYLGEEIPYQWKTGPDDFEYRLYSNDLSRFIQIYFTDEVTDPTLYFDEMAALAEPDFAGITNDFTITAQHGGTSSEMSGYMNWHWGESVYTFPIAECDFPVELFCNDKENLNREDLENLFGALIENNEFTPAIVDVNTVLLDSYDEYTDNLEVLTGDPEHDDYWNVTYNDGDHMTVDFTSYIDSHDENRSNCTANFYIDDAEITDNIDDDDLGELISLTGDYTYTIEDYTYDFVMEVQTEELDTVYIRGNTTCVPIKDCDDCHQEITDIYEDYTPSLVEISHTETGGAGSADVAVYVPGVGSDIASIGLGSTYSSIIGIGKNKMGSESSVPIASNTMKKILIYARYVSTIIDTVYKVMPGVDMEVHTTLGDTPPTGPEYTVDEDCVDDLQAFPPVEFENDCIDQQLALAYANATESYNNYLTDLKNTFKENYVSHCMSALETFSVEYDAGEYQYTLYYYDQAANLVMTVPPKGVDFVDEADFDDIDNYRDNVPLSTPVLPDHTMTTRYAYNSLNQLIWQSTPDAGESRFWYDGLGRMVLSQNAKQNKLYPDGEDLDFEKYSYTAYDDLSRIEEVGELWTTPDVEDEPDFKSNLDEVDFPADIAAYRYEVTLTKYDGEVTLGTMPPFGTSGQENLRKRIASVFYQDVYDPDLSSYDHATHYSYDIHGNVKTLIQDNPSLAGLGDQFKTIQYNYDLISGNVNEVLYQDGDVDRFYHKYLYDADNRIDEVYTSRDNKIWERDGMYMYYRHGPLARMELGDLIVQGLDYAYTIHGWLKGVNAGGLNVNRDMGGDGQGSTYRKYVGIDAYGFVLDYYDGDYTKIDATANSFIPTPSGGGGFSDASPDLFNGNIKAMTTALMETSVTSHQHDIAPALGKVYHYDQLNRLIASDGYEKSTMHQIGYFTWSGVSGTNKWGTRYTYDANGNILTMLRAGNSGTAFDMDSLTYNYLSGTNKLDYVNDDVGDGIYTDVDIDNQTGTNYDYDEIGNLIQDTQGGINSITWTVYGKIKSIDKASGSDLEFAYDAMGNRIMKKVIPASGPTTYTYYVRDAQGNVMATYSRKKLTGGGAYDSLFLSEQHIYGSSRLGYVQTKVNMGSTLPTDNMYYRTLGKKRYELNNHLGNVLVVVTDRRFAVEGSGGTAGKIRNFEADVVAAQDYDPFGMITYGRSWQVGSDYRYGFNGKENIDEIAGNNNDLDFGARVYNSRLGKWLSVDLLAKKYPAFSPYNSMGDNPLFYRDPDGMGIIPVSSSPNWNQEHWDMMVAEIQKMDDNNIVKMLWNYYAESTTLDIYFAANSFEDLTGPNAPNASMTFGAAIKDLNMWSITVEDNKLVVDPDNLEYLGWFESFNGLDISKSAGKSVSLVALEESFMTTGRAWKYLSEEEIHESINFLNYVSIHEIAAHISEIGTNNGDTDHGKYGEYLLFQTTESSIAWYINLQLDKAYNGESLTSEDVAKSMEIFQTLTGISWTDYQNSLKANDGAKPQEECDSEDDCDE